MSRKTWLPLVLVTAAIATIILSLAGSASGAGRGPASRFQLLPGGVKTHLDASQLVGVGNKRLGFILELAGRPVAVRDAASKAAGHGGLSAAAQRQARQDLRSEQSSVKAAAKGIGATVTASYQTVYNGIAVQIRAREAYKLAQLNGVISIHRTKTFKFENVNSVPLVGGPQTWGGVPGYTGTGMKIADLDTGLDYTHADFGGSGDVNDFNCAFANDTTDPASFSCPGGPASQWFGASAPKVKGGWDFVGDDYNADPTSAGYQPVPHPDANPLDCNGHGSHTAGTAAGFGVLDNGTTYGGPYNAGTVSGHNWNVGPGVAPNANIYALRVFGCSGSVDDTVLISAIDWAVSNHMDVINMSLGANFGSASDPDSVASSNAAADGVIVAAASGNAGPAPYITSSPAAGTNAISVAANDSTADFPGADLALSIPGTSIKAIDANGYPITPGAYNLVVVWNNPANHSAGVSLGCSVADDESVNGGNSFPANTYIVVQRGVCARVAKAIFGQQAGAAGVIMINTSNVYPPYEGKITSNPDTGEPYTVTIPFLGVKSSSAATLKADDGGTVSPTATTIANPAYLALASFSSYGPSTGGMEKPEVTAPGVSVDSALIGSGNEAELLSGTSMATPHVAGEALLVKQAHPSWGKVEYWKDAIVNTADPSGVADFSNRGAGAGLIQAYNATHTQVVAGGDPHGSASLSFGVKNIKGNYSADKHIQVRNFGKTKATFNLADTADQGGAHGVTFFVGPNPVTTVTVPKNGMVDVKVVLNVPLASAASPIGAFSDLYANTGVYDDIAGLITLTPTSAASNGGIGLSVPYYAVPTASANATVKLDAKKLLSSGHGNATVTNPGGGADGYADWFSWGGSSPVSNTDIGASDLLSVGLQSFPAYEFGEFAVRVNKPWTNPAADEFDVYVDVDGDNSPDYVVVSADCLAFGLNCAGGIAVTVVIDLATGDGTFDGYLTGAMFNGTTMELPFDWGQLCTTACISSGTPIRYAVYSFDRNGGSDSAGAATFNLFSPTFSNGTAYPSGDVVSPGASVTDPVTLDKPSQAAWPQLGVLVLAQNNRNGGDNHNEAFTIPFH